MLKQFYNRRMKKNSILNDPTEETPENDHSFLLIIFLAIFLTLIDLVILIYICLIYGSKNKKMDLVKPIHTGNSDKPTLHPHNGSLSEGKKKMDSHPVQMKEGEVTSSTTPFIPRNVDINKPIPANVHPKSTEE